MPEAQWLSVDDERARYAHHDNTATNEGYVRFLGEVVDVVDGLVAPGARVLDFGSGEHQVLVRLLRERGHAGVAYDPLYGIGPEALGEQYDVIVLCEVIEHLRALRGELAKLAQSLCSGGRIVVRTRCYPSLAEIPEWWYTRDPTHINFFAQGTLDVAARLCGLACGQAPGTADIFVWTTQP